MKKRLFAYNILIILVGLVCFFAASVYITSVNNLNFAKDTVKEITQIYAGLYDERADIFSFVKNDGDIRITVISKNGAVLADNHPLDVAALENHLNRPEIKAADSDSPEAYIRYSNTLSVNLIYYALKVNSGDGYVFIRVAVPVAKIDAYLSESLPFLIFSLLIIIVFCLFLTRGTVNRIVKLFSFLSQNLRLLSAGEYKFTPVDGSYEEINEITREIDEVALILQNNFYELNNEKNKLKYILNNIADGILVADENKNIVLINSAALSIFNVTPDITHKNLNYVSYDKTLIGAVEDCVNFAKNALFELTLNGNIFLITVKRLPDAKLAIVVLSDVTENRESAKRREEFFANASHELKTPLTAIKGFNELTALNNKDESIRKYIDSITRETDRMLSLICDMLKLSELENTQDITPASVSLAKVVNEAYEAVSIVVSEKSIIYEIDGDGTVTAKPEHIYELIKNLIENAVRYSNQGGKVSVKIENNKKAVLLIISDNGIGISPDEQTRIFERFYRVERSRSGRSGGTGLGLSIVKHICALYDWKLSLKSKLGVGTEITVIFGVKQ